MSRLPTVLLARPDGRGGKEYRKVNETDYATDISRWVQKGFKIVSNRHGDASDAEIQFSADQADIERHRRRDPDEQARRGDDRRRFDEHIIRTGGDYTVGPAPNPRVSQTARKLIELRGLDASAIQGSGKNGRILKGDVPPVETQPA